MMESARGTVNSFWTFSVFIILCWTPVFSLRTYNLKSTFHCTKPFGQFPDPNSCEGYWICNNNNSIAASCSFGLIYSHVLLNCDWASPEICTRINGKVVRNWTPPPAPTFQFTFDDAQTYNINVNNTVSSPDFPPGSAPSIRLLSAKEVLAKWQHAKSVSRPPSNVITTTTPIYIPAVTGPTDYTLSRTFTAAPKRTYTAQPLGDKPLACNSKNCKLPDCYCTAKKIPGGLKAENTPQIVMVTFDDAANGGNAELLDLLFTANRTNPNGCPITGTFFLANPATDYNVVRKWARKGQEVASHSLSDLSRFKESQWQGEIVGEAKLTEQLANVKMTDIVGMRAPFLAIGGNTMFRMLWKNGFLYDSSIPSAQLDPPLWPYTLDTHLPQRCFRNCPTGYFPGLWEVPMTDVVDVNGMACSMYDACTFPSNAEDITDVFWENFMRHYNSNRAPFLLSAHPAWFFNNPNRVAGMLSFMDKALQLGDVWFLSVKQTIQWMQKPTDTTQLSEFKPFKCR